MKNNITELVFILDKSGSMSGLEQDTIGGFNAMIEKQKALPGKVYVSTVLFSNDSQLLHDRRDIRQIVPLTKKDYAVGGCTALMDALGGAIHHIGSIHKYARAEDVPGKTIFIITTDGMENASHHYSADEVRRMIRRQEEKYGWEFLFLAANIDAAQTAERYGIRRERSANYCATPTGTAAMYDCVNKAVTNLRCEVDLGVNWSSHLDKERK